jgi:hypothetical protein
MNFDSFEDFDIDDLIMQVEENASDTEEKSEAKKIPTKVEVEEKSFDKEPKPEVKESFSIVNAEPEQVSKTPIKLSSPTPTPISLPIPQKTQQPETYTPAFTDTSVRRRRVPPPKSGSKDNLDIFGSKSSNSVAGIVSFPYK